MNKEISLRMAEDGSFCVQLYTWYTSHILNKCMYVCTVNLKSNDDGGNNGGDKVPYVIINC